MLDIPLRILLVLTLVSIMDEAFILPVCHLQYSQLEFLKVLLECTEEFPITTSAFIIKSQHAFCPKDLYIFLFETDFLQIFQSNLL